MDNKFKVGEPVTHISGNKYIILEVPEEHKLIEYTLEPFYKYKSLNSEDKQHYEWIRPKSQMEDGRFKTWEIGL